MNQNVYIFSSVSPFVTGAVLLNPKLMYLLVVSDLQYEMDAVRINVRMPPGVAVYI